MPTNLIMPQLGESVTEGTIGKWLKKAGDPIKKYEPLVEVITDKVNAEVPSPVSGILKTITAGEGATVKVGALIALIEESHVREDQVDFDHEHDHDHEHDDEEGLRKRLSPAVRRIVEEHHLDVSLIKGTGMNGRVTRDDVLSYITAANPSSLSERQSAGSSSIPPSRSFSRETPVQPPLSQRSVTPSRTSSANGGSAPTTPETPGNDSADDEEITLTPIRRAIAEHMVRSIATSPHAWTLVEIDMTAIARYRASVKEEFKRREGVELTYLPFFIRAIVEGLKKYPDLNAIWHDEKIIRKKKINIGVAVDVPEGLLVPVIHEADQKSLSGIARTLSDLVVRARNRRLQVADMQGGTFTVNNPGSFGSIMSQPIINQPQAAIVTMEHIVKRPVVLNDAIAIRAMMNCCISFDHRMLDGATAGRFLQSVKYWLENFNPEQNI